MTTKDFSHVEAAAQAARDLDPVDRMALDFLHHHWNYQAAKEEEIRRLFDMTPIRFYQRVNALLDDPLALAYAPATVRRLQRQRDANR